MKSIKLLISEKGFELLKIRMEEWYTYEYIINNLSEIDNFNIINNPTIIEKTENNLIYFFKDDLKEYDVRFLEMSLKELKNNNILYCYIFEKDQNIITIFENHIEVSEITKFYDKEKDIEMEE